MKKRANIIVSGRVQGVFFRVYAKQKAEKLKLIGWIRNVPNGQVEIVAEGEEKDLKDLIKQCYNGPSGAKIEEVTVEWGNYKGEFNEFKVLV